jgi:hypothetical protein
VSSGSRSPALAVRWAGDVCDSSGRSASPEVNQALRARIGEFYQEQVGGKFRHAEALVAEETKDYFYSASQAPLFELRN